MVRTPRRISRWLRDWLGTAGGPETLAVLRIAVAATILGSGEIERAERLSRLSPGLREAPAGFAWLVEALPPTPALLGASCWVLRAALVLALVGVASRWSLAVATVVGVYVLGVPQLFGDTLHDHHLLWVAAILACSPCSDAFGWDAWRAARRGTPLRARRAYALPCAIVWLVLASIYFFPGLAKLRESGLGWLASENLANRMHEKWWMSGRLPTIRIDRHPLLLGLGAAGVVALELSFPVLVVASSRTRAWAAWGGLGFHALTATFLDIRFGSLLMTYVVFFDWTAITRSVQHHLRLPPSARRPRSRARPQPKALLFVSGLLLMTIVFFGVRAEMRGWPVACYPTFAGVASGRLDVLRAVGVHSDGSELELWLGGRGRGDDAQRWWAISNRFAKEPPGSARLEALANESLAAARKSSPDLVAIRLERATYDVSPERSADPPIATLRLVELKAPLR